MPYRLASSEIWLAPNVCVSNQVRSSGHGHPGYAPVPEHGPKKPTIFTSDQSDMSTSHVKYQGHYKYQGLIMYKILKKTRHSAMQKKRL